MGKGAACAVTFAVGAAMGFIFAEQKLKKKYDQMVEQEVQSIKASFRKYRGLTNETDTQAQEEAPAESADGKADSNLGDYETLINDLGYTAPPATAEDDSDGIHIVISENEFNELDDYESLSFVYLADGVLVDDDYDRMSEEEIQWAIGDVDLKAFGEDEATDTMYVKNTKLKVAYEIIKDSQTYAMLLQRRPYLGL